MADLVRLGKAPHGVIPPPPLVRETLFSLDVDDPIWDDTGLEDVEDQASVPQWLGNENVRTGIKALLMVERCEEELVRLRLECQASHRWVREEWDLLMVGLTTTGESKCDLIPTWTPLTPLVFSDDENVQYQIGLQARRLVHLYHSWKLCFRSIPYVGADDRWGPEAGEILFTLNHPEESQEWESDGSISDSASVGSLSDEIVQALETLNIPLDLMVQ